MTSEKKNPEAPEEASSAEGEGKPGTEKPKAAEPFTSRFRKSGGGFGGSSPGGKPGYRGPQGPGKASIRPRGGNRGR